MNARRSKLQFTKEYSAHYYCISATVVSQGAVLRAMHKDAIVERYLRRSFGSAWDEPYDIHKHGDAKTKLDKHDGVRSVEDRIHWLFKFVCLVLCGTPGYCSVVLIQSRMKQYREVACGPCEDGGALH